MATGREKYLTEKDVSQVTGLAVQTLRNWRFQRRGIPWVRVSMRCIRYSLADVIQYMESRKIEVDDL